MDGPSLSREPLRQRLPGYLTSFGVGLGAAGLVGLVIGLATPVRLTDAVGYAHTVLGGVLLLTGGVRGSGYGSRPAEAPKSGPGKVGRPEEHGGGARRWVPPLLGGGGDLMERRRRRLLSPPDPAAFWQVLAGAAYFGIGVLLTVLFAGN